MNDTPEAQKTEKWTAFQRILPLVIGAVFVVVGLFILLASALNYVQFTQYVKVGYIIWSVILILFGLFVLILRLKILPAVRKPE